MPAYELDIQLDYREQELADEFHRLYAGLSRIGFADYVINLDGNKLHIRTKRKGKSLEAIEDELVEELSKIDFYVIEILHRKREVKKVTSK